MSVNRRTQAERTEETTGALISAARRLFASRGFAATGTQEIVEAAGVTRGALYHHFDGKEGLFRAVYEAVETDVVARVMEAAEAAGQQPLPRLEAGAGAFLDAATEPEVQRIVLVDAPAVFGWDGWREIDAAYGLGVVTVALEHAMEAGAIRERPVEPLAHVVLGALREGALFVARAGDTEAAREEVGAIVAALLAGLADGS